MSDVVAGAPIVYPGRVDGDGPLHLGRTEARKGRGPAVIGICPPAHAVELVRAVESPRRWWWPRRRAAKWCPYCAQLRDHLRDIARAHG